MQAFTFGGGGKQGEGEADGHGQQPQQQQGWGEGLFSGCFMGFINIYCSDLLFSGKGRQRALKWLQGQGWWGKLKSIFVSNNKQTYFSN